ncbi:MAG: site-specific integrase [Candidatus Cloacimonetes bacterium]|nr:site-specific integrase [Candidatus Cloacimonadota bacterium]
MNYKKDIPKILKTIRKVNIKKKIKLRYKKLSSGYYSLYLDMWYNGIRQYEFLKIYIKGSRNNYIDDDNKLRLAISIRDKKELELLQQDTGFELSSWRKRANFIDYFNSIVDKKPKSERAWRNTWLYIKKFTKGKIEIKGIDEKFCEDFKDYLLKNVTLKNLSQNTANLYLSKFKASLNQLVKEKIIQYNPARDVHIRYIGGNREFLTLDEIKMIKNTPARNIHVKNAFIFSCFTGLRLSDILSLTFNQIEGEYLIYKQQKTNEFERIKLTESALAIINKQKELVKSDKVFLISNEKTLRYNLNKFVKDTGIKKHITFHSARHTFATLCLTYDIDLYTVSKLLGHKDIKSTQIYAKLIDKKKDAAVDKLPKI